MMTNEQYEKFKNAVFMQPLPDYVGMVEVYNPKTDCYCTVGLALRNLGYNLPKMLEESKSIKGEPFDPYGIFCAEFGLSGATIGCANDDFVHASLDKICVEVVDERSGERKAYAKAPAREIVGRVLSWISKFQKDLH